jgi:hypothetical protein
MRTNNHLTLSDTMRVASWIRKNEPSLLEKKASYAEAAELASKDLKVKVTEANMTRTARAIASELKWHGGIGKGMQVMQSISANRVAVLYNAVADLYERLGENPPADVAQVLDELNARETT